MVKLLQPGEKKAILDPEFRKTEVLQLENRVSCIVMAAGLASRFGSEKLLASLDGEPLISRVLRAVPLELLSCGAVVAWDQRILQLARSAGFLPVENNCPEAGVSRTISLGLQAVAPCDGALFLVADQPLLRRESVKRVIDRWLQEPDKIVGLSHNGQRGNPCLFPSDLFGELMALTGDRGGNAVIRRHEDRLVLVEAPAEELMDVDRPDMLLKLEESLHKNIPGRG